MSGRASKSLRGHWPGPDTECVVWLFQCFPCPETWGRDPCSPGPAPRGSRLLSPERPRGNCCQDGVFDTLPAAGNSLLPTEAHGALHRNPNQRRYPSKARHPWPTDSHKEVNDSGPGTALRILCNFWRWNTCGLVKAAPVSDTKCVVWLFPVLPAEKTGGSRPWTRDWPHRIEPCSPDGRPCWTNPRGLIPALPMASARDVSEAHGALHQVSISKARNPNPTAWHSVIHGGGNQHRQGIPGVRTVISCRKSTWTIGSKRATMFEIPIEQLQLSPRSSILYTVGSLPRG